MKANVIKVIDDSTVVINKGQNDGIRPEDRFVIYEEKEEITDPNTGENLGKLQLTKGTAKVQSIQERMSVLVSDKTRTISKSIKSVFTLNIYQPIETYEESQMQPFEREVEVNDIARVINRN